MMAILYFHTEMYYAGKDVVPYACYVDNALSVFFFISGYLMLKEDSTFNAKRKLKSIVRGLIVPYFFFTLVMAFPKAVMHGQTDNLQAFFIDVVTGDASWFASALITGELAMTLFIKLTRGRTWPLLSLAVVCSVLSASLANQLSPWHNECNIWHVNEAMLGCVFMSAGYLYHRYESQCHARFHNAAAVFIALVALACTKSAILAQDLEMVFGPVIVSSFAVFLVDNFSAVILLTACFRRLPSVAIVEWTGRHSLVYYFICGGVPLLISAALGRTGLVCCGFLSVIPVFIIVYATATVITWLAYRYLPFVLNTKKR